MSPVQADTIDDVLAERRESLALAAYHEILEGHEINVPVLVVIVGAKKTRILRGRTIREELDSCLEALCRQENHL